MIKETDPPNMGKLVSGTRMNHDHFPFLEDNNSTAPLQKGGG